MTPTSCTVNQKRAADAVSSNTTSTSTKPKFKIRLHSEVMNQSIDERRMEDKQRAEKLIKVDLDAARRRKEKEELEKAKEVLALKETAYKDSVNRNDNDESIEFHRQEVEAAKQHERELYASSLAGHQAAYQPAYQAKRRKRENEELEKAKEVLASKESAYKDAVNRNYNDESIEFHRQEVEAAKKHERELYASSLAGYQAKWINTKTYYDGFVIDKRTFFKGLEPYLQKQNEYVKGSCKKAKQAGNILVGGYREGTSPEEVALMLKAMCM